MNNLTGAELQTLREGCGMSRDEFATLVDVQPRTVKHWEIRMGGVPADVAEHAKVLDARVRKSVAIQLKRLKDLHPISKFDAPLILTRYRDDSEVPKETWGELTAAMHGAAVLRLRDALMDAGYFVRIVWNDPSCIDSEQTLSRQALQHRGDQPHQTT